MRPKTKFYLETFAALTFMVLCVSTVVSRDWIEVVFGVDPDMGSGSLEWGLVAGFGLIALGSATSARRTRRLVTASSVA